MKSEIALLFNRAKKYSLPKLFIKILKKLLTYSIYWVNKHLDLNTDTRVYIKSNCNIKNILQINNLRVDKIDKQVAQVVADFYCQHLINSYGVR